jgi:hypothetical protein
MFDKLKNIFTKSSSVESPVVPTPDVSKTVTAKKKSTTVRKTKKKSQPTSNLTAKEIATQAGEPYIAILSVDVDPSNINSGSFELDWNDKFIINLIKSGYKQRDDDTDQIIVDRWFQTVCRNIALEIYEQRTADPAKRESDELRRVQTRDLGNGRTEIS